MPGLITILGAAVDATGFEPSDVFAVLTENKAIVTAGMALGLAVSVGFGLYHGFKRRSARVGK